MESLQRLETDQRINTEHVYGHANDNVPVAVGVKVRPQPDEDLVVNVFRQEEAGGGQVQLNAGAAKEGVYAFDYVFPMAASNADVWAAFVRPCVEKLFKSVNSAVFAYGGTGSGKSYMMGFERNGPPGQLQYAAFHIFQKIREADVSLSVYANFFEVYGKTPAGGSDNANVFDLFHPTEAPFLVPGNNQLRVLSNCTHIHVNSAKELIQLVDEANLKRQMGAQGLNSKSSRSHAVVQVMLASKDFLNVEPSADGTRRGLPKQPIPLSKMSIIDLAGSEPAHLWRKEEPKLYNEAIVINLGLGALKSMMKAMADNRISLARNNSMLTRMLSDILDLKSKGYLRVICTVNPILGMDGYVQSLTRGTLEYAKEIKSIKIEPGVEADLFAMQKALQAYNFENMFRNKDWLNGVAPHLHMLTPLIIQRREKARILKERRSAAPPVESASAVKTLVYENNAKYEGTFDPETQLLRHGQGSMIWTDGTSFTGQWVNDFVTGNGHFMMFSGKQYKGKFLKSRAHGKGVHEFSNGYKYSGDWENDQRSGFGQAEWDPQTRYQGQWLKDKRHGEGLDQTPRTLYKGTFMDDLRHGRGRMEYSDGNKYVGEWSQGLMEGKGQFFFANGATYVGEYLADQKHGFGKYKEAKNEWSGGHQYLGYWQKNMIHGEGEIKVGNVRLKGEWHQGKRIK